MFDIVHHPSSTLPKHRLFYIVGQLDAGGLERQLWYLLSAMDQHQYRPGVAVWSYDPRATYVSKLKSIGVPVYPINREGGFLFRMYRLRKLVQAIRPEVLHSYSLYTNFPAWLAMLGLDGIVVGSIRNDYWADRASVGRTGGALCSMFPRVLIANSFNAQTAALSHRTWTALGQVEVVPNCIDLAQFVPTPLPDGPRFEIVGIGRLYPQKGWGDMLQALAEFGEVATSAWRFRLCGEGPLLDELLAQCQDLSLCENVEFLGFQNDVASILSSSHVLALSSRFEGTPNVVIEAMASGRPVVATAVGDVPRLLRDGQEGYIVPVGDTSAMADRLLRLMSDRELARRMGNAARRTAESALSPEGLVERTLDVYRKIGWKG